MSQWHYFSCLIKIIFYSLIICQNDTILVSNGILEYKRLLFKSLSNFLGWYFILSSIDAHKTIVSRQLRDLGILIISVTQPIDTKNPAGVLQQNILFFRRETRKAD